MLSKQKTLFINSYPRCGNTYLGLHTHKFIEINNIENVRFTSNNHDHELILHPDINQISILRDPLSSITSYALMNLWPVFKKLQIVEIIDFIDDISELYVEFMSSLISSKNVAFILFEDLISRDINKFIIQAFNNFDISLPNNLTLLSLEDSLNIKEHMKSLVQNNTYSGHYPRSYDLMPERNDLMTLIKNSDVYEAAVLLHMEAYEHVKSSRSLLTGL